MQVKTTLEVLLLSYLRLFGLLVYFKWKYIRSVVSSASYSGQVASEKVIEKDGYITVISASVKETMPSVKGFLISPNLYQAGRECVKCITDFTFFSGILTPTDEFQYWAEVAMSGNKLDIKERAQHFQELFQPIAKDFGSLDALSLGDAMELVELCQDTLDDVWKQTEDEQPYPEKRMKHLMDVIGKKSS
jgi:hypothetical protein